MKVKLPEGLVPNGRTFHAVLGSYSKINLGSLFFGAMEVLYILAGFTLKDLRQVNGEKEREVFRLCFQTNSFTVAF